MSKTSDDTTKEWFQIIQKHLLSGDYKQIPDEVILSIFFEKASNFRVLIDIDIKNSCFRQTILKNSHILIDTEDKNSINNLMLHINEQ